VEEGNLTKSTEVTRGVCELQQLFGFHLC